MKSITLKNLFVCGFMALMGMSVPALADTPPHKNAPPSDSVKPEKPRPELAKSDTQPPPASAPPASAPNASANPQDTAPAAKRQFVKPSKEKPPHGDQNTRHKH